MPHADELLTLEERLTGIGWEVVLREFNIDCTDIDLLVRKENSRGMNYLLIEEKGGRKARIKKATKQVKLGMRYVIDNYNLERLWGLRAHRQAVYKVGVYEKRIEVENEK